MVLSFALCASFAFAQTNRVVGKAKLDGNNQMARQSIATKAQNGASVSYKGSIFAKDDTIALFDFSMAPTDANANYSFGTIGNNETINGTAEDRHAQPYAGATWHRWVGVDSVSLIRDQNMAQVYPEMANIFAGPYYYYSAAHLLDTDYCSSKNGWVMLDLISTEQGSGAINAYIALASIPTTDVELFSIRMFEFFWHYSESTFIDYSTDNGATWNAMQINTGVAVNSDEWGRVRFTMPTAAATGNSVLLRIRCKSTWNRGYGYIWMLDDVAVTKNKADEFTRDNEYWDKGGYDQMPKGFATPVEWASRIINSGYNDQTNTQLKMDNIYAGNVTNIASMNLGTVVSTEDSIYEFATNASLPTSNVGDNFVTVTLSSDNIEARPYDTILYVVNDIATDGSYTWARDNGILNAKHSFLFGFDTATYTDEEGTHHYIAEKSPYYTNSGNTVYVLYETGSTVPTDGAGNPWVIRGIEYVVAVDPDVVDNTPAQIAPTIVRDSATDDGYISFLTVPTGISSYTTDPATEYVDPEDMQLYGFMQTSDQYKTVRIDFATQPELMPDQQYHVGYELLADARFAVAHSAFNTYSQWDAESGRYKFNSMSQNAALKKYAHNFTYGFDHLANGNHALIYQPNVGGFSWAGRNVGYYPMIRLLVGPRSATKAINVTCEYEDDDEELGGVYSAEFRGLCGSSLEVVEGASTGIYIIPEMEGSIATLTVDGEEVDVYSLPATQVNTGTAMVSAYFYEFNNVTADHEVVASFAIGVGINDVASRVKMNLQPNPASSNVKLNIAGVTGSVNCDLLDMSGRVVRSSRINAEAENTISLNGLAKGAYFVRITNSDFTKVERLIVR